MPTSRTFLHVGFNNTPYDPLAGIVWTDLSPYVRDDSPVGTRRGRQQITSRINVGTLNATLDNRYGLFEALNASGRFFGLLLPDKPVRYGLEYPWLPGLIPDPAFRQSIVGWSSTNSTIARIAPVDDLAGGTLRLTLASASSPVLTSPAVAVPAAQIGTSVTAAIWAQNASAHNTLGTLGISFYSDAAGTALISSASGTGMAVNGGTGPQRITATATVPATTVSMRVTVTLSTGTLAAADIINFQWAVLDYTAAPVFSTSFVGYSKAWNCDWDVMDSMCAFSADDAIAFLGGAKITTPFYGNYLATLGASKWYRFGEGVRQQSDVRNLTFKDSITGKKDAYVGTGTVNHSEDSTGLDANNMWPATSSNGLTDFLVANGPLPDVPGCSPLDPDGGFSAIGPASHDGGHVRLPKDMVPSSDPWSMNIWVQLLDNAVQPNGLIDVRYYILAMGQATASGNFLDTSKSYIELTMRPQDFRFQGNLAEVAGRVMARVAGNSPSLSKNFVNSALQNLLIGGGWTMLTITYSAANNRMRFYVNGNLYGTAANSGSGSMYAFNAADAANNYPFRVMGSPTGTAVPYDPSFLNGRWEPMEFDELMMFNGVELSAATITQMYVKARTAAPIERSTQRVARILDLAKWPTATRVIDSSKGVQVTDIVKAISKANPLQYLQTVEDSEMGFLYASKGGDIVFVPHTDLIDATSVYNAPQYTFGTGVGELTYEKVGTTNDDALLYTGGEASTEAGPLQVYIAPAEATYRPKHWSVSGLILDADEKAYNVAEWFGTLLSNPGVKLNSMVVNPDASDALRTACAAIDLGTVITVRLRPPRAAAPYDVNVSVQGISEDKSRGKRRITYSLTDIYAKRWMNFNDNFSTYPMAI